MAFVPFTDGARACVEFAVGVVDVSVCLHFRGQSGVTPGDYQALADTLNQEWKDHMLPEQSNTTELTGVRVYDLNTASSPIYESLNNPPVAGGIAATAVPLNVAMVISHSTGKRGRSFRGRTYIPGLPENQVGTRDWTPAIVTLIQGAFTDVISGVESLTQFEFVVASRVQNGVELTLGEMTTVTNSLVKAEAGTRRKRLPGNF